MPSDSRLYSGPFSHTVANMFSPKRLDAASESNRDMRTMTSLDIELGALTIAETADVLRVSRRHLQNLLRQGDGPPVIHLGRRRIIRREALSQWLVGREIR